MNIQYAMELLGIDSADSTTTLKTKYRRLIAMVHPDSGSTNSDAVKTQELNEAYRLLKSVLQKESGLPASKYPGQIVPGVFCCRRILEDYSEASMGIYGSISRYEPGRYLWDPELEEFEDFMHSINLVASEQLEKIEEKNGLEIYNEDTLKLMRYAYQIKLFEYLSLEFIDPIYAMDMLYPIDDVDDQGNSIYHFKAMLSNKSNHQFYPHLQKLTEGELIFPAQIDNNKIVVRTATNQELGYLSMEDNRLYFCLIPLLKSHCAQIKMTVKKKLTSSIEISLLIKITADTYHCNMAHINEKIESVLDEYTKYLMDYT